MGRTQQFGLLKLLLTLEITTMQTNFMNFCNSRLRNNNVSWAYPPRVNWCDRLNWRNCSHFLQYCLLKWPKIYFWNEICKQTINLYYDEHTLKVKRDCVTKGEVITFVSIVCKRLRDIAAERRPLKPTYYWAS